MFDYWENENYFKRQSYPIFQEYKQQQIDIDVGKTYPKPCPWE